MARKTSIAALVVGLIVATSFVGAAAFTTATVERDVTVGIAADNQSIIQLQEGNADAVDWDGDQLKISPDKGTNGLNLNATFKYGNNSSISDARKTYAFNITNRDNPDHTFTLSYTQSNGGQHTLKFWVVHGTDSNSDLVTKHSPGEITLAQGETAYVVVIVDSGDGLTDIDGTLTINAS